MILTFGIASIKHNLKQFSLTLCRKKILVCFITSLFLVLMVLSFLLCSFPLSHNHPLFLLFSLALLLSLSLPLSDTLLFFLALEKPLGGLQEWSFFSGACQLNCNLSLSLLTYISPLTVSLSFSQLLSFSIFLPLSHSLTFSISRSYFFTVPLLISPSLSHSPFSLSQKLIFLAVKSLTHKIFFRIFLVRI